MKPIRWVKISLKTMFINDLALAIIKYLYDFENVVDSKISVITWLCCLLYCILCEIIDDENIKIRGER